MSEQTTKDSETNAALSPLAQWNLWPAKRDLPKAGTFEIGICMAGAISAGAYTAGVLDMLIEALDTYQLERDRRKEAGLSPLHAVQVSVLGGSSAGG
ncbi:MAG TPA: hypothetical protein VD970_06845, partial [Acetobacteraceae bacterium]|nr:hypothetical protein [Acetobacteraceae bacterium]